MDRGRFVKKVVDKIIRCMRIRVRIR